MARPATHEAIYCLAAEFVSAEDIADRLELPLGDVTAALAEQKAEGMIAARRKKLISNLPIMDRDFRLIQLNNIVTSKDAGLTAKLAALRVARAEQKGEELDDDDLVFDELDKEGRADA